jgi:hypothetical protein
MKSAFIQLKNGYNTVLPHVEFMTNESDYLELWGEKGRIGIFISDQVEMCVITEKWPQKEENNGKVC